MSGPATERDGRVVRHPRPTLIYDGDCGFCTASVRFLHRHVRTAAAIVPFQATDLDRYGIPRERAEYEVVWVDRAGRISGGAQAVARLLMDSGALWWPVGAIIRTPPFRWVAHGLYRLIANHRGRLPGGTPACALAPAVRPARSGSYQNCSLQDSDAQNGGPIHGGSAHGGSPHGGLPQNESGTAEPTSPPVF